MKMLGCAAKYWSIADVPHLGAPTRNTLGVFPLTECIFDASPRKAFSVTMVCSHRFLFLFSVSHANAWRACGATLARPARNRSEAPGIRRNSPPARNSGMEKALGNVRLWRDHLLNRFARVQSDFAPGTYSRWGQAPKRKPHWELLPNQTESVLG